MSIAAMMRQQVVLVRPVPVDRHGDPVPGGVPPEVPTRALVQPRLVGRDTEDTDLRNTVVIDLVAYLPAGTTVSATDKVRVDGVLYEVSAEPARFRSLLADTEYVQVGLQRVEG